MARTAEETRKAKRELSDNEFVSLCSDVMVWIGERIDSAVSATREEAA